MKLIKTLALGTLALALASMASAVTVKVTGSTAFRASLYASIINQLGNGTVKAAYVGSSLAGANQAVFSNGTDTVQACMAGSVGGINWIVNDVNVATAPGGNTATAWLSVSNITGATATASSTTSAVTGGSVAASPVWDAASIADFTMSDSLQDSTPYDSGTTGITLTGAAGGNLGVVQFVMAKGTQHPLIPAGSYNALTNMSALAFQNLANQGIVPLSYFTGVATDNAYNVVLVGRDNDSGTRLATTFETGLGSVDTAMSQFRAFDGANDVGSGTGVVVKSLTGVLPQAGYASGSQVKKVLNAAVDSTALVGGKPFILVAYVGTGDKPTAAAQVLTYNGYAQNATATQNGQYSFWTYEQAYYKTTDAAKIAKIEAIAGGVQSTYATVSGGLLNSSMLVSRGSEGTVVF